MENVNPEVLALQVGFFLRFEGSYYMFSGGFSLKAKESLGSIQPLCGLLAFY